MPTYQTQGVVFAVVDQAGNVCSTITTDKNEAWTSFFRGVPHGMDQKEAIRAYSSVGYRLVEFNLSEYDLLESIVGNLTYATLKAIQKDLQYAVSTQFFPQAHDAVSYINSFIDTNFEEEE